MKMKHDELQEDLAAHLRANGDRMVWTNTQLGPAGSPRPDVFTVNKSFSKFRTDCYEIKISISDLRSDVTSGKWQSYRRFGHAVWFAFPRGLVPLDLIPRECGVICRSDTGWRAARKPVAQVLDTLPRDAWLKLLMECFPAQFGALVAGPRRSDQYHAEDIVRKKLGDKLARLFADTERTETTLTNRRAALDAELADMEVRKKVLWERAQADAKSMRATLDDNLAALAAALGVPEDDRSPQALNAAIVDFRRRIQGGGVEQAIKLLQGLQGVLPANDPSMHRRGGW